MEAEARANQLCFSLVRWADDKKLAIAHQKSSVTLLTSDTHQCRLHPHVRIGDATWPRLTEPLKLWVSRWTPNSPSAVTPAIVSSGLRGLFNVIKALAGLNWGFTTETLVTTYKAIVRLIINYAAPIWFTQVSSSNLGKLEMIQNKALRFTTGCLQMATASHLRAETGVLPLSSHLELCSQQFYASTLQPLHPCHLIVTSTPDRRPLRATLQASYHRILRSLRVRSDYPNAPPLPPQSSYGHSPSNNYGQAR